MTTDQSTASTGVVPDATLTREDGTTTTMSAVMSGPTLFVFLRHLACLPCQNHLHDVARRHAEFAAKGVGVVAVSMSPPSGLKTYLARHPLPIPLYCDPEKTAYRALGLERTTWLKVFNPIFLAKYTVLMVRAMTIPLIPKGEDPLQLGGDFILDGDRRLVYAHRGTSPMDRPSVDELLRACEQKASGAA